MGYKNVRKTRQVPKTRTIIGSEGVPAIEVYYETESYTESVYVADTSPSYDSGSSSSSYDSGGGYSGE